MSLLNFVNSISYDGFPNLLVHDKEFFWNGYFWEYVGW